MKFVAALSMFDLCGPQQRTSVATLASYSVFEPTGRANARPMTGSVGTGSREENASKALARHNSFWKCPAECIAVGFQHTAFGNQGRHQA